MVYGATEAALERVAVPVLIVDRNLQLIDANRRGKALLERQDALRVVEGKVVCGTEEQTDVLVRAVETRDRRRLPLVLQCGSERAFDVVAASSPYRNGAEEAIALTVFAATASDSEIERALRGTLRLTEREAHLAVHLYNGRSMPEAARAMGTELSTARTHLKSIAGKTGLRRQTQIVRVVTSIAHAASGNLESG